MKEFVQLIVKPKDNVFVAYLTCKTEPYEWWELCGYGLTPIEATTNVYNEFIKDEEGWPKNGYEIDIGIRLKDMICPQCNKEFTLSYTDYVEKPITLVVHDCPSGGIYNMEIRCPHCNYVEEL